MKNKGKKLTSESIIHTLELHDDLLRKYKVKRIGLFGSYIRGDQTEKSDIDFLVEFRETSFDNFMDLSFYLEKLFGKKIELITNVGLSPHIRPFIMKEVKWYEA